MPLNLAELWPGCGEAVITSEELPLGCLELRPPPVWGEECRGRQRGCYSSKWLICPNVQMLVLVVELIFGSQHPFVNAICIFSWCENWWFTPLQHVTLLLRCLSIETKHDKNQIFNHLRIMFHRQVHLLFSIFRSTEGALFPLWSFWRRNVKESWQAWVQIPSPSPKFSE